MEASTRNKQHKAPHDNIELGILMLSSLFVVELSKVLVSRRIVALVIVVIRTPSVHERLFIPCVCLPPHCTLDVVQFWMQEIVIVVLTIKRLAKGCVGLVELSELAVIFY